MCLSTAYWNTDPETPIFEEIASILVKGEKITLRHLMGQQIEIKGKVCEIDFLNATILLEKNSDT